MRSVLAFLGAQRVIRELGELARAMGTTHNGNLLAVSSVRVLLQEEAVMEDTSRAIEAMQRLSQRLDPQVAAIATSLDGLKDSLAGFALPDKDPRLAALAAGSRSSSPPPAGAAAAAAPAGGPS